MRTYKANLPEGVKKTFGAVRGVKVKLVAKKTNKKNTKSAKQQTDIVCFLFILLCYNLVGDNMKKKIIILLFLVLLLCSCGRKNDIKNNDENNKVITKINSNEDVLFYENYKIIIVNGEEHLLRIPIVNSNSDDALNVSLELKNEVINTYMSYKLIDNVLITGNLIDFDYYCINDYLVIDETITSYLNEEKNDVVNNYYVINIKSGKLLFKEDFYSIFDVTYDDIINYLSNNITGEDSDYIVQMIKNSDFNLYINKDNKLTIVYNEYSDDEIKQKELVYN